MYYFLSNNVFTAPLTHGSDLHIVGFSLIIPNLPMLLAAVFADWSSLHSVSFLWIIPYLPMLLAALFADWSALHSVSFSWIIPYLHMLLAVLLTHSSHLLEFHSPGLIQLVLGTAHQSSKILLYCHQYWLYLHWQTHGDHFYHWAQPTGPVVLRQTLRTK